MSFAGKPRGVDRARSGGRRSGRGLLCGLAVLVVGLLAPQAASADYDFGVAVFGGSVLDGSGQPVTQAGAHPNVTTRFEMTDGPGTFPAASPKDVRVDFPPGFVFNPTAVATCSSAELAGKGPGGDGFNAQCPASSQVGLLTVVLNAGTGIHAEGSVPLYNVDPAGEAPGRFAANVSSVIVNVDGKVRSGGDYGISAVVHDTSQTIPIQGAAVTIWGVPADPSHNTERGPCLYSGQVCPTTDALRAVVDSPTDCSTGLLKMDLAMNSWENPGVFKTASFDHDFNGNPLEVTGCNALSFAPSLAIRPLTRAASAPVGPEVSLSIPQSNDPNGLATARLRRAVVQLPKGMAVNTSSADGLGSCSPAQIDLHGEGPANCPDASQIGDVTISTPLLAADMTGEIYLAKQNDNPFNSLLAVYLVAKGPGVVIKLPGKVEADPVTGQLTATFNDTPQLPFSNVSMRFKGGPRAPLTMPSICGTYQAHAELTAWSGQVVNVNTPMTVDQNCDQASRFTPGFEAGTTNPAAGSSSPFTLRVTREDGQQNVSRIDATLPEGVLAKLAGVPLCGNAAAAGGDCPAASQVGTTTVGLGAGSNPLYVPQPGNPAAPVYLAGPYKGAPYSLVVKVPAQAGPFDLGTVAVRNAIDVDPVTTQVSVSSNPLPQILQGIPISYQDIRVDVSRNDFTLNPTSCDPMAVDGTITSAEGKAAPVSDRFQVANCERLGFGPKLALKLSGPTHRSAYPGLRATLTMPKGGANIQSVAVELPKTEILAQEHIQTICTRVQFAAHSCPAKSIYGYAKAWSPLLDKPLQGPVYLRSSSHKLPDLVASLDGQIHIDLAGRIDSVNARIRNTFEAVPDAPVSKFVLTMQGGKKGLLVNNTELCKAKPRADAKFDAQNGKVSDLQPLAKVDCGKGRKGAKK